MSQPCFSVIVPVYNRPEELAELLTSLAQQTQKPFEVVVVEDGSLRTSEKVVEAFSDRLSIQYAVKPNSGPGPSRNFGFTLARGDYFVLFDSDCLLPAHYFETVTTALARQTIDAWGGPDRGHASFSLLQRAMAYTMSSVLTTGGIRGKAHHIGRFQPRSFNMGLSRAVWEKTQGFRFDRLAEDIELSIRMHQSGFAVVLIPEAYVFHKRRATFRQFFKQVFGFARGRVRVGRAHAGEVKWVHAFPSVFTLGLVSLPVMAWVFTPLFMVAASLYGTYLVAVAIDAWRVTRSAAVAFLSIPAALVQLTGYGLGFLVEGWRGKKAL
ncbi:MAG: glycosyltransferase [Cyclobacteriaceae bacterium]|jgi:GT2 family glycosyltransferase|nr:glycosyltransferase [Cyclobacteriaceae bacterium]